MKQKNRITKKYIIAIIALSWLFVGIGYSYLNSNLKINGTASIAQTSWNIYFSNIVFKEGNVEATSPATIVNNTTLTMDVTLEKPKDVYSFDVDIVNDGTIDAMLTEIFKTSLTEKQQEYLEYTITYNDGNEIKEKDLLKKKSRDTITVTVKYKEGKFPTENEVLSLSLTLNYVQDDGTGNGTRIKYDLGNYDLGNNNWYKSLTLNFQILDDEKITSAKYCITTENVCIPDKNINKENNVYSISFDNASSSQVACLTAVDKNGVEYSRCSNQYKVDGERPRISTVTVTPDDDTASIEINGTDEHSSIKKYYYSKDSGNTYISSPNPNYTFTTLEEGDYLITVYLEDVAGNISEATAKNITIRHKSWCEKNGIQNLSDCILTTEQKTTNIEEAKNSIVSKGTPNFQVAIPVTKYNELKGTSLSNYSSTTYSNVASDYTFNSATGYFSLKGGTYQLVDPTTKDYTSGNYYTCGSTSTSCTTLYKINSATKNVNQSTGQETYVIKKYNYTSSILSYDNTESGLYAATDDDGTSYYYRGSVGGNYVKFANKYWRIIRVNGDNSIRLVYDGTKPHSNGEASSNRQVGTSAFNSWWSDNAYVGYMYGDTTNNKVTEYSYAFTYAGLSKTTKYYFGTTYTFDANTNSFKLSGTKTSMTIPEYKASHNSDNLYTCFSTSADATCQRLNHVQGYASDTSMSVKAVEYGSPTLASAISNTKNSNMKTYLENWYQTNLLSYDEKMAKNTSFCNDRQISSVKSGSYQNAGYGATPTIYEYERFYNWGGRMTGPKLTCSSNNDRFTVTTSTTGNKKLTYPIGLLTADEVNMAGARTGYKNELFYLYTGTYYWTLSPPLFSYSGGAREFYVTSSGELTNGYVYYGSGVRPVINLDSSNLTFTGSGTKEDPYVIT